MNFRMVLFVLGRLFLLLAALLCLPLIVSFIYGDGQYLSFIFTIVPLSLLGAAASFIKPKDTKIFAKEGFVIVAFGWILMALTGAVPLLLSNQVGNYVDCLFEISSGFTTTGASILRDVEVLSPSIAFWRCFSIWIGGMGVLVFLLAILPKADGNMQSMHIFRAEAPGPQVNKISSKLQNTSRWLYAIYVCMTLIQIILLLCGGLNLFESVTCAMSTAGTGGFYIYNASIGHFNSVYVEMVVAVFMILYGVNFNIFYLIVVGKVVRALKSEELRWYIGIFVTAVLAVSLALTINSTTENFGESVRYGIFQVASIMSTTGFTTTNFGVWPHFAQTLLLTLMIIGASAGSTGGGIKVSRFVLLGKSTIRSCKQMVSPNGIMTVKFEGKMVDDKTINNVHTYFAVYICFIALVTLLISVDGFDIVTNFSATLACINNIGPGLSLVGPTGNYADYSIFSKIILTLTMIAGRLELFPIIMLGMKKTWS